MWPESGFYNQIVKTFNDYHCQTHQCLKGDNVAERERERERDRFGLRFDRC